jgi:hypothetical protein
LPCEFPLEEALKRRAAGSVSISALLAARRLRASCFSPV